MASSREKNDPYIPMDAALAQPAPEEEPIHVGPVTLGSLFRTWRRVLEKHFWWGVALWVLPNIATAIQLLINATSPENAVAGSVINFFVTAPLSSGAGGALLWRLVGSGAHGPLRQGPVSALFWGFRFFGIQFLYGLLLFGCWILAAIPLTVIFASTLWGVGRPLTIGEAPGAWAIFAAACTAVFVLGVFFTTRWSVVTQAAVAEDRVISLSRSASLVRPAYGPVFVFLAIASIIFVVLPGLAGLIPTMGWIFFGEGPAWLAWIPIAAVPLNIACSVLFASASAAVYFALTAGEQRAAPEAPGVPTDPTDPTDRSELQEAL
jgi:hypothetical protein